MILFYILFIIFNLIQIQYSQGFIKSWQITQNYANKDLFNEFNIIFQLEYGITSSDIIIIKIPFSIGDLREYPKIKWGEIDEFSCIFDNTSNTLKPVFLQILDNNIYEYTLKFEQQNTNMQSNKWYNLKFISDKLITDSIPLDDKRTIFTIGMATYSDTEDGRILYNFNENLGNIFVSSNVKETLVATALNIDKSDLAQDFQRINQVTINIKTETIEESGRYVIKLTNNQFTFETNKPCTSVDSDSITSIVIPRQSFKCNVQNDSIEILFFNQPIVDSRAFNFQFYTINSKSAGSSGFTVYLLEPYVNQVIEKGSVPSNTLQTKNILLDDDNVKVLLSFGVPASQPIQLYKSLIEYTVYNTITISFQVKKSTPDVDSILYIELGTGYFTVLENSIQDNLSQYSPLVQNRCLQNGQQIICKGVGQLKKGQQYTISFKLLINYNYKAQWIPQNFLNIKILERSTSQLIVNGDSIYRSQVLNKIFLNENLPRIQDGLQIFAHSEKMSLSQQQQIKFGDATGISLRGLQFDPIDTSQSYLLLFLIKYASDYGGVEAGDNIDKGYRIVTTSKLNSLGNSKCVTAFSEQIPLDKCQSQIISTSSGQNYNEIIMKGNSQNFQKYFEGKLALVITNMSINGFAQYADQYIYDFFVTTHTGGLTDKGYDESQIKERYLVNSNVIVTPLYESDQKMNVKFVNYFSGKNTKVDAFETTGFMQITSSYDKTDFQFQNIDYPLQIQVFLDSLEFVPFYSRSDLQTFEKQQNDFYVSQRVSCFIINKRFLQEDVTCNFYYNNVYKKGQFLNFNDMNRLEIKLSKLSDLEDQLQIIVPFKTQLKKSKINYQVAITSGNPNLDIQRQFLYFRSLYSSVIYDSFINNANTEYYPQKEILNVSFELNNISLGQKVQDFKIYTNIKHQILSGHLIFVTQWQFIEENQTIYLLPQYIACYQQAFISNEMKISTIYCEIDNKIDFSNSYLVINQITIPYIYGTTLPRSSISISDEKGNLVHFNYIESKNRVKGSTFIFDSIYPNIAIAGSKGIQFDFQIQTSHQLASYVTFLIRSDTNFKFQSQDIQNGCFLDDDMNINSQLLIQDNIIQCKFQNDSPIQQGKHKISVISITVNSILDSQNDIEQLLSLSFLTSHNILISSSDRGRKLVYQNQKSYKDNESSMTIQNVQIQQTHTNAFSLYFQVEFQLKDWMYYEFLQCDLSFFLKAEATINNCLVKNYKGEYNFIQRCYIQQQKLILLRKKQVNQYEQQFSYKYTINLDDFTLNQVYLTINKESTIKCSLIEQSDDSSQDQNNIVLEYENLLSKIGIQQNFFDEIKKQVQLLNIQLRKNFAFPGIQGSYSFLIDQKQKDFVLLKSSYFLITFPPRYQRGLGSIISCFQDQIQLSCEVIANKQIKIHSLAQDIRQTSQINIVGIEEPIIPRETQEMSLKEIEFLIFSKDELIQYTIIKDEQINYDESPKIMRFSNMTISTNETFTQSDYYNLTFSFPEKTPEKVYFIIEFPITYAIILNTFKPESCFIQQKNVQKNIPCQCQSESNRITVRQDNQQTFQFLGQTIYTLYIKGIQNAPNASQCNSEKINILVFDNNDQLPPSKKLIFVSGKKQSASPPVSLQENQLATQFVTSKQSIQLIYGVISDPITIQINTKIMSKYQVEFSNKYSKNVVQLIPEKPQIEIGNNQVQFRLQVFDEFQIGYYTLFISQFSQGSNDQVIKDIPPLQIFIQSQNNLKNNENLIRFPFTHLKIPQGGYSLPLIIQLDQYTPLKDIQLRFEVENLPESAIQIDKGEIMIFKEKQVSSYLILQSDQNLSKVGTLGKINIYLEGNNSQSFLLQQNYFTFEIINKIQEVQSDEVRIVINESTLSPISQIFSVFSIQSLTLYCVLTTDQNQFELINIKQAIDNIQKGQRIQINYLNQIETITNIYQYEGEKGSQDYILQNLYQNKYYYLKIFPVAKNGNYLGEYMGTFKTTKNNGKLIKVTFRFQDAISIEQQIQFTCQISSYFSINVQYLTTTTGIKCNSHSNYNNIKDKSKKIQIVASENPNSEYISLYISYNKNAIYDNFNDQIYVQLINEKTQLIDWYTKQIDGKKQYTKLFDYYAINDIIIDTQPNLQQGITIVFQTGQTWVAILNIKLNINGYIWVMIDEAGHPPPNYNQVRQNKNSLDQLALCNYMSYYSQITDKTVTFNITNLAQGKSYDIFYVITGDDPSDNMDYMPILNTYNIKL